VDGGRRAGLLATDVVPSAMRAHSSQRHGAALPPAAGWAVEQAAARYAGPILLKQEIILKDEDGHTRQRRESDARWDLYAGGAFR